MKNKIMKNSAIVLLITLAVPFVMFGQEKKKTVNVKTVQVENGKKTVKDTTFTVQPGDDVEALTQSFSWTGSSIDSAKALSYEVEIESDADGSDEIKKVIILKERGGRPVRVFKGDDGEVVVIKSKMDGNCDEDSQKNLMKWTDDDSVEYEFEWQESMDGFQHRMEIQQLKMAQMQKELEEHLAEIYGINEEQLAQIMDEVDEMNFYFVKPPKAPKPPKPLKPLHGKNFEFYFDGPGNVGVTDIELRDANIKNKPDRLDLDEIDLSIENGVVDISFAIKGEANPSVAVYNVYGDKVFSGKPVLINGKFEIKIDLSQKQHGTYYWQIVDKDRSFTDKIKI